MTDVAVDPGDFTPGEELHPTVRFGLPLATGQSSHRALLGRGPDGRLELRPVGDGTPLRAAFGASRRGSSRGANASPLARAMGISRGVRTVVDATAGLGRDAWELATEGCQVILIERVGWLAALLEDAIYAADLGDRATLIHGDASALLPTLVPRPDAVYLDPMFGTSAKSALPKRDLQLLRELCEDGSDEAGLLAAARRSASRRVVVKRRLRAPPFAETRPSSSQRGNSIRFDLYGPAE